MNMPFSGHAMNCQKRKSIQSADIESFYNESRRKTYKNQKDRDVDTGGIMIAVSDHSHRNITKNRHHRRPEEVEECMLWQTNLVRSPTFTTSTVSFETRPRSLQVLSQHSALLTLQNPKEEGNWPTTPTIISVEQIYLRASDKAIAGDCWGENEGCWCLSAGAVFEGQVSIYL